MHDSPFFLGDDRFGSFRDFADQLKQDGIAANPLVDGKQRFSTRPLLFDERQHAHLAGVCDRLCALFDEAIELMLGSPETIVEYFQLPPTWLDMTTHGGGNWHGFVRFDLFWTGDRWTFCELNADTPSGQTDAVGGNNVMKRLWPEASDPMAGYAGQLARLLRDYAATLTEAPSARPSVGLIYPTDLPEDLDLIAWYADVLTDAGYKVIHGAPHNLVRGVDGRVGLFAQPIDLMLRHYKTDWWGARLPVTSQTPPFDDDEPLVQLPWALDAERNGHLAVVNPFGAMPAQNKLLTAWMWANETSLSQSARDTLHHNVPRAVRLLDMNPGELLDEQDKWVLKSDFGCEGEEVLIGPLTKPEVWEKAITTIYPDRWIAQSWFEATPLPDGRIPNIGAYVVGGEFAGVYTRLSPASGHTDVYAQVAPTLVVPSRSAASAAQEPNL